MTVYEQGDLLAQAGMDRAEAGADSGWLRAANHTISLLIARGLSFTTDDVWALLDATGAAVREPRALGALMRKAALAGLIRQSGEYRKTTRPEAHSRPIPVWMPTGKREAA